MDDSLTFIPEIKKGSFINSKILPATYGSLEEIESPESAPIYGFLIEGSKTKENYKFVDFQPLAFFKIVERKVVEYIIVGIRKGNPEALDCRLELDRIARYIESEHIIISWGEEIATKHILAEMLFKKDQDD